MNIFIKRHLTIVGTCALLLAGCSQHVATSESERAVSSAPTGNAGKSLAKKYNHQLVRRPGHSDEDSKVYVVENGKRLWITKGTWITAHGYKWPQDVHIISAEDLASIPEGDAIQVK